MIDTKFIGHVFEPFEVAVEAGRLRFFAKATGQQDLVYSQLDAAKAAGFPNLPVPPTFFKCLESEGPKPAQMRELLAVDFRYVLHGEQHFTGDVVGLIFQRDDAVAVCFHVGPTGQHLLEGFGSADDGAGMLFEIIEEAIFTRHEFAEQREHGCPLHGWGCHAAVIIERKGAEKH